MGDPSYSSLFAPVKGWGTADPLKPWFWLKFSLCSSSLVLPKAKFRLYIRGIQDTKSCTVLCVCFKTRLFRSLPYSTEPNSLQERALGQRVYRWCKQHPGTCLFFFFKRMPNFLLSRAAPELITGKIHQPTPVTGWVIPCFISLQLKISIFVICFSAVTLHTSS